MYILANSGVYTLTANLAACIYPSQFVVGIDILLIQLYDLFCVKNDFKFQVSSSLNDQYKYGYLVLLTSLIEGNTTWYV